MGRENTISTGNIVRGRKISSSSLPLFRNIPESFDYGVVTSVDNLTGAITFSPLKNNLTNLKPGSALPFNKNKQTLPKKGQIIPVLRAPSPDVLDSSNVSQRYTKVTFYMDPVNVSGTMDNGEMDVNTSATGNFNLPSKVRLNTVEQKTNMSFVKDYCKNKGLNKEATAGIMGNIMKESTFNPTAGWQDVNGFASLGLIQWNGASFDLNKLGSTVQTQMDALFDLNFTKSMRKYLDFVKNNPQTNAWTTAYQFAKDVEICSLCNKGEETYKNGGTVNSKNGESYQIQPVQRSQFALEFMNKFNDPDDELVW